MTSAVLLKVEWPETYSGKGGVTSSDVQLASAAVWSLPSVSASRIAVIGLQKPKSYFVFQATMAASARPTFSSANRRAFSETLLPWASAICSAIWFQWPGGV